MEKDLGMTWENQDLELMDEPGEFDYKNGKKVKVYPISAKDAIKLFSFRDKIINLKTPEDFEREFNQDSDIFKILGNAVHRSAKSMVGQSPTFLVWLVGKIWQITDIDFFSKEVASLIKKATGTSLLPEEADSALSPKLSDASPKLKAGK